MLSCPWCGRVTRHLSPRCGCKERKLTERRKARKKVLGQALVAFAVMWVILFSFLLAATNAMYPNQKEMNPNAETTDGPLRND